MRFAVLFPVVAASLASVPLAAVAADTLAATFTVSQQTLIPGLTLTPGSYSIRVVDHLQDRYIVRISSTSGSAHSTFLGVQDRSLKSLVSTGAVPWTAGPDGKIALRGYSFGVGSPALEFVYPKADAVAIAKVNDSKVPAVDPASEGRSPDISALSKDDMEIVSLWMLSATRVGPNDAAPQIKAEHYQQVATARPPHAPITQLPHTSSNFPLIALTGLVTMAGAAGIRARRWIGRRSGDRA